jgi:hypothetical protein
MATALMLAKSLSEVLNARPDPMLATYVNPWLAKFQDIPADASRPLAMSGPHPRAVGSYGDEFVAWCKDELGVKLRWWQELAAYRQLEHDDEGNLVHREIVESGPRRIGKSVRLRSQSLWRINVGEERIGEKQLVMLTSKDLAVGKEIHRGAWRWAEARWGRGSVIRLNGGQEVIAPDDSRWLLRADTACYGYDVGYAVADESWSIDPAAISDGLEPATLERIWPQLHLTSTAHVKASSLMRKRMVTGLRNADPDLLLLLWGAHPDRDYADPSTWKDASPHWSEQRRQMIERKYLAAKAGELDPELDDPDPIRGWASQYLNVWPNLFESGKSMWPNWSDLASQVPAPAPAALGVATDPDNVWLSLGAASGGERPHLGSVLRVRAVEEAAFVAEAARIQGKYGCPVVVDVKGPAGYMVERLESAGVDVTRLGLDDLVTACTDMDLAVRASAVTHGDYTVLNDAAANTTWRKIGDRRVFGRRDGDISMMEAVTLALYLARRPVEDEWEPMVSFA